MNPRRCLPALAGLLLVFACFSGPLAAEEAPTLAPRYRFCAGDAVAYRITLEGKGVAITGSPGVALPVSVAIEMRLEQKVTRVGADGAGELAEAVTLAKTAVNQVSLLPAGVPLPVRFTETVAPSGLVLAAAATAPAPGPVAGVDLLALAQAGRWLVFPDAPLKVGESWHGSESAPSTTTLAGVQGRVARLKHVFSGPAQTRGADPAGGATVEGAGEQAGDLLLTFDLDAGRVTEASGSVDYHLTCSVPGGGQMELILKLALRMRGDRTVSEPAPARPRQ